MILENLIRFCRWASQILGNSPPALDRQMMTVSVLKTALLACNNKKGGISSIVNICMGECSEKEELFVL